MFVLGRRGLRGLCRHQRPHRYDEYSCTTCSRPSVGARAVIIDPPARHPAEIDAKRPATPERRSGFTDA